MSPGLTKARAMLQSLRSIWGSAHSAHLEVPSTAPRSNRPLSWEGQTVGMLQGNTLQRLVKAYESAGMTVHWDENELSRGQSAEENWNERRNIANKRLQDSPCDNEDFLDHKAQSSYPSVQAPGMPRRGSGRSLGSQQFTKKLLQENRKL
ncbi:unnamed protein product [Caretta caretta]